MKALQQIKENLPVILFVGIIPYFFYSEPSIAQAIIAAVLGSVASFKYYLEHNAQPDYVKIFNEKFETQERLLKEAYMEDFNKLTIEIEKLRSQHNSGTIQKNIDNKINLKGWG